MSIDINMIDTKEKLALACLYFAKLPSNDERYKGFISSLDLLAKKYNANRNTLKNDKDRFDAVFDNNGRVGWDNKPLEQQHKFLYEIYRKYENVSIEELQATVNEILNEARAEEDSFYSIKTKSPEIANSILNKEQNIEINGLNILKDQLKVGQAVFIVLGGDRGKPTVTWEPGLVGIGVLSEAPYALEYDKENKKNYKIKINIMLLLEKPIKREELISYKDTFDIIGIGPMTKWEPNQAISQIPEKNAIALMRAMLDLWPGIETYLEKIVSKEVMDRVKGPVVRLVPMKFNFGEKLSQKLQEEETVEQIQPKYSEKYEPDIPSIIDGFILSSTPVVNMCALINTGKHIIFTGSPGTGKTTLAERACLEAKRMRYVDGYLLTTAISDWTTFDTIGGYMPGKDGQLEFQEGIFLKSIRENKWLLIDEINRAEVDKAFGHFFTVLSGMDVDLQFKVRTLDGERPVSIKKVESLKSYYDDQTASYCVGRNWRMIATMNTYDKNSLFMLSYAFMRRFAFVHINVPTEEEYTTLISKHLAGHDDIANILVQVVKTTPKKLGAAIILDLISFIEASNYSGLVSGICSLIIPQYEGIGLKQIKRVFKDIGALLAPSDRDSLMNYLCEFFDISKDELLKVKFKEETADDENDENDDDEE